MQKIAALAGCPSGDIACHQIGTDISRHSKSQIDEEASSEAPSERMMDRARNISPR